MVKVDLKTSTLAVLVSGLHCVNTNLDAIAIPESVWIAIAEKLEYFLPDWNYEIISFEDWIKNCLFIFPKVLLSDEEIKEMQESSLCWEYPNGNVMLFISMDIKPINGG